MKVLYAIQGTGNGHLNRAREIIPVLQKHVHELDLLISGAQHDIDYDYPIKYRYKGLTFLASKTGRVSYFSSLLKMNFRRFMKEVRHCPAEKYDLIITDFEPVSAWAAKLKGIPCIEMSHQAGVLMSKPRWKSISDLFILTLMKKMCPSYKQIGFHFTSNSNSMHTPVIRQAIRELQTEQLGHYTVYLPGYSNAYLANELSKYNVKWHVFTKDLKSNFNAENIEFKQIDQDTFLESIRTCEGVMCGAGFELPAEALYLRKKLMVIPLKGQFEQECNAIEAEKIGAKYIPELSWKYHNTINHWTRTSPIIDVYFPNDTEKIIVQLLNEFSTKLSESKDYIEQQLLTVQTQ
jgi:uncharacterized protein (TIGR00661 family)